MSAMGPSSGGMESRERVQLEDVGGEVAHAEPEVGGGEHGLDQAPEGLALARASASAGRYLRLIGPSVRPGTNTTVPPVGRSGPDVKATSVFGFRL